MKYSSDTIVEKFDLLNNRIENLKTNTAELGKFIRVNFAEDILKEEFLADVADIHFDMESIKDEKYRKFMKVIYLNWDDITVKTPDRTPEELDEWRSMIPLPHYFIKTGDSNSFPEMWQNFLIVRGLLTNHMYKTAENIILNVASLLENREFVPLTNRIYATKRTQLPLFAFMVEDYIQVVKNPNMNFLEKILPAVTKDFNWWIKNAKVEIEKDGKTYILYQYKQQATEPRPELYKDDHILSHKLTSEEKRRLFSALRAIDETAFGNSNRFRSQNMMSDGSTPDFIIEDLVTVELNSVLQKCATFLASWYYDLNNMAKRTEYQTLAANIQTGIDNVLWSSEHNIWLDWNIATKENINKYYVTNLMGLLTSDHDDKNKVTLAIKYLRENGIISKYGSSFMSSILPSSNEPYGSILWNVFAIDVLRQFKYVAEAREIAKSIAFTVIRTMYKEHMTHKTFFEQYKVEDDIELNEALKLTRKSAAGLGCFITLLDWYKDAEYDPPAPAKTSAKDDGSTSLKMKQRLDEDQDDSGKDAKKLKGDSNEGVDNLMSNLMLS